MLAKRIIPCLDIDNGRVVKGTNFVNIKDAGDPIERAKCYDQQGADELVFLDITASSSKREILIDLVRETAAHIFIPFTVGGGIRSVQTIHDLLRAGADKVSINSAAIKNPNIIKEASEYFGNQCIVVAVDAKKHNDDWFVYSHGGTKKTDLLALSWIEKAQELGAGEILLTSMDKDGTKSGFDNELLGKVSEFIKIPVIASGGVGALDHFYDGVVKGKADALLAASVFHFNEISIKEVKEYLKDKNISIRD